MIKIAFTAIRPHFEKKIKDKDNDKKNKNVFTRVVKLC